MKPRVFVSSTYYDLKHVRERMERFIENYHFEPVLFESNNVMFEHYKPLDLSCYNEVKLCHMMILIIGGRYGAAISGENVQDKKDSYNKEYTSITRKEFETAIKMHIPVFIFVEKNVYAEYHTYSKNKIFFEGQQDFNFAHVDDINIFKFINYVERNAIKTFETIDDIEQYLKSQLSGMLYLYLQQLKEKHEEDKILDSVSELKSISKRMNEMLIAVGKNVITDNSFNEVLKQQNKMIVDFFIDQFTTDIKLSPYINITEEVSNEAAKVFMDTVLNEVILKNIFDKENFDQKYDDMKSLEIDLKTKLANIDEGIKVEQFDIWKITGNFYNKIIPILNNDEILKHYLDQKLSSVIKYAFLDLPF